MRLIEAEANAEIWMAEGCLQRAQEAIEGHDEDEQVEHNHERAARFAQHAVEETMQRISLENASMNMWKSLEDRLSRMHRKLANVVQVRWEKAKTLVDEQEEAENSDDEE